MSRNDIVFRVICWKRLTVMTGLPEVTVRRRGAWSTGEKVAILDAAFRHGGSVPAAADRFDVSRALITSGANTCETA